MRLTRLILAIALIASSGCSRQVAPLDLFGCYHLAWRQPSIGDTLPTYLRLLSARPENQSVRHVHPDSVHTAVFLSTAGVEMASGIWLSGSKELSFALFLDPRWDVKLEDIAMNEGVIEGRATGQATNSFEGTRAECPSNGGT